MGQVLKTTLAALCLTFFQFHASSQSELITDGSFESNPWYTYWNFSTANGDLWGGLGACTPYEGSKYVWLGDQYEDYGVNGGYESMYQTVTIPSNTVSCTLYFALSVNTTETGTIAYDELEVSLKNTSGSVLYSFGTLDNTDGDYGIPGCQSWDYYYVVIPTQYFGYTLRVSFDLTTDSSYPTIFRLDDISLLSYTTACNYSLSQSSYTCPNSSANTYFNVASVTVQNGCTWSANVVSGSSWLSTSSSGTGNGNISVTVAENTTGTGRTGTIDVMGEILSITQPGFSCTYTLSSNSYILDDHTAGTFNVALVTTGSSCFWDAEITSSSPWIITTSSATGSGSITVTVTENNSASDRIASIDVEGQTILITQPADWHLTGVENRKNLVLKLYPNPVQDVVTLSASDVEIGDVFTIYDLMGRVVFQGSILNEETEIPVKFLSSGSYILMVNDEALRFMKM